MLFCRAVEINGGHNYGEFGNCGCFGLEILALLCIIILMIHQRYHLKTNGESVDDKYLGKIRGPKYIYYLYKFIIFFQLTLVSAILLSGILFNAEGANAIAFYVDQCSRIIGWMLSFQYIRGFFSNQSMVLYCTLSWGLCQVATGGMNCIYYGVDSENSITSFSLVGYFTACILYLTLTVRQLLRSADRLLLDSPLLCGNNRVNSGWDGDTHDEEDCEVESRSQAESSGRLGSINASVDPALLDSLFVKPNHRVSSTATASTQGRVTSVDSGSGNSLRLGGTEASGGNYVGGFDMGQSSDKDLVSSSHEIPSSTLERKLSETNSDAPSASGSWAGGTASIASPAGRPSSQRVSSSRNLLRRDNYFPGDVAMSVASWDYFDLNGTAIATYRLEWSDRSGFRSGEVTKRLDEILYLREKISSEFPHITMSPVPLPPSRNELAEKQRGGSSPARIPEAASHSTEMESYLSDLLAHPIAGKLTWTTLCDIKGAGGGSSRRLMSASPAISGLVPGGSGSVLGSNSASGYGDAPPLSRSLDRHAQSGLDYDAMSEGPYGGAGSVAKGSIATEKDESAFAARGSDDTATDPAWISSLSNLTPMAPATVSVSGFVQGVALENSRDKILFLVSVTRESTPEKDQLPFVLSYHIVKKRFKQFRSLHTILCQCDERFNNILFPSTSKKVNVNSGREFDSGDPLAEASGGETITMNRSKSEIVAALNSYIQAIIAILPRPAVIAAFLESDIHQCGTADEECVGFDVVCVDPPDNFRESDSSGKPLSWFHEVKTSEASFRERTLLGELRSSVFQASDGMVLPLSAPPLNYLGDDWREQLRNLQGALDTDGLLDVLGMKTVSPSATEKGAAWKDAPHHHPTSPLSAVCSALGALLTLIDFVGGASMQPAMPSWPDSGCPVPDKSEFLQDRAISALNCMSTAASSEVFAEGKDGGYAPFLCGVWVYQFRLRRLLTSTTAFSDFCLRVHRLSEIDLKTMRKCTEFEKNSFLINLYNLISLHAAIMLPWPDARDKAGRGRWQQLARYEIGGSEISLLQIEYAFIRSRLRQGLSFPTLPGTLIPPPGRSDIKNSACFAPNEVDVRELLALSLPHRSSNQMHLYSSDSTILTELHSLVGNFIVARVRCLPACGKVYLPKVFRRLQREVMLWRRDVNTIGTDSCRPAQDDPDAQRVSVSGSLERPSGLTRSSVVSSGNSDNLDSTDPISKHSLLESYASYSFSPPPVLSGVAAARDRVASKRKYEQNVSSLLEAKERQAEGSRQESQGWDAVMRSGGVEDSSSWDLVAADCGQSVVAPQSFSFSEEYGDDSLDEEQLTCMRNTIHNEVEVKDRQYHFRTYKDCFLGRDAVECLRGHIAPAKSVMDVIGMGNLLVEFGIIEHVSREHWLKNKELFYILSESPSHFPEMTPFQSFIMNHLENTSTRSLLEHQISASLDLNYSVTHLPEDYRFSLHIKKNTGCNITSDVLYATASTVS